MSVVEGDQETLLDAERIGATGARVVQVNTGAGCHLDATMLARAMAALAPPRGFGDGGGERRQPGVPGAVRPGRGRAGGGHVGHRGRGQAAEVPAHVPHGDLVLLNKVDLLPYVDFDVATWTAAVERVRPGVEVLSVSATRGDGLDTWYALGCGAGSRVAARGHRHLGVALQEDVQHAVGALQLLHLVGEQGHARPW
jgi:hydrogenase nickel incorporation protein HypB